MNKKESSLSFQNIFQHQTKLAAYIIVCMTILVLGLSYALFLRVDSNSANQVVTAGDLSFTYKDGSTISSSGHESCFLPMSDDEAVLYNSNCSYQFSAQNSGTLNAHYTFKLIDNGSSIASSKLKYVLKKQNESGVLEVLKSGLVSELSDGLLTEEDISPKAIVVYSIQVYIFDDSTVDTDISKAVNYTIDGSGLVKEDSANPEKPKPTASEYITKLAATNTTNLAVDDYGNVRYIGKNPNNYVRIEGEEYISDIYRGYVSTKIPNYKEYSSLDECTNASSYKLNCKLAHAKGSPILWRIIGVMKDIDDGTGSRSDRVKIISDDSIGDFSWDTSESSINKGGGVNEWSQADLMKLLNPGYESEAVGGSLYWNSGSGTCYSSDNNETKACNFTSAGIKDKLKSLISDAVWNTGANDGQTYTDNNIKTAKFYELERSNNTGKICTSGQYCNDTLGRTTTWTGKVGLMYPSDYGYATSGGSTTDRTTCLNINLAGWNNYSDCKNNDWLYNSSSSPWTISPVAYSSMANLVFSVHLYGHVFSERVYYDDNKHVRPVVYLTSNVGIQSGDGSSSNPFILSEK